MNDLTTTQMIKELQDRTKRLEKSLRQVQGQSGFATGGAKNVRQQAAGQSLIVNDLTVQGNGTITGTTTYNADMTINAGMTIDYGAGDFAIKIKKGANDTSITKTEDSDELTYSGDLKVVEGKFASSTVEIGTDADNPYTINLSEENPSEWWLNIQTTIDAADVWMVLANLGTGSISLSVPDDLNVGAGSFYVDGSATSIAAKNGTSINEFSTDITLGGNSDNAVPTEKAVKTYIDAAINTLDTYFRAHLHIGSSNVGEIVCVHVGSAEQETGIYYDMNAGQIRNRTADDFNIVFLIPLETTRHGLKLYLYRIKLTVTDADAAAYIETVKLYGADNTLIDSWVVNWNSAGNKELDEDDDVAFPYDISGYSYAILQLTCVVDAGSELDFTYPLVEYYYGS